MSYWFRLYRKLVNFAYQFGILAIYLSFSGFLGCSLEEKGESGLRAHDDIIQGISHAHSSKNAPRYCKSCHGNGLQGGKNGEPSCFQCHGENWDPIDSDLPRGDANHTVENGGFFHHQGISTPLTSCTSCHGLQLQGDEAKTGNPSCFLCHEKKW